MKDTLKHHIFLSHSDKDKKIAMDIKKKLEPRGIYVFVAHEDINGGTYWEDELFSEIQNCDVFMVLFSKEFHSSNYTDQEIGIALRSSKPILPVCIDEIRPYGFTTKFQGIITDSSIPKTAVRKILDFVKDYLPTENLIVNELIRRLKEAYSYNEAHYVAREIDRYDDLTSEQVNNIAKAYDKNPEIYQSYMASPVVRKILRKHSKKLDSKWRHIIE